MTHYPVSKILFTSNMAPLSNQAIMICNTFYSNQISEWRLLQIHSPMGLELSMLG